MRDNPRLFPFRDQNREHAGVYFRGFTRHASFAGREPLPSSPLRGATQTEDNLLYTHSENRGWSFSVRPGEAQSEAAHVILGIVQGRLMRPCLKLLRANLCRTHRTTLAAEALPYGKNYLSPENSRVHYAESSARERRKSPGSSACQGLPNYITNVDACAISGFSTAKFPASCNSSDDPRVLRQTRRAAQSRRLDCESIRKRQVDSQYFGYHAADALSPSNPSRPDLAPL